MIVPRPPRPRDGNADDQQHRCRPCHGTSQLFIHLVKYRQHLNQQHQNDHQHQEH